MKNLKKFIASLVVLVAISNVALVPTSVSAESTLFINPDTGEVFSAGPYDELLGWNSDGTPIIKYYVPATDVEVIPSDAIDDSNIIGDSDIVGDSDTGIRGDINYDGKVNVSDLIYLRRYLLHLIKW